MSAQLNQPMKQWEKAHTGSGVVYYVNHVNKKTQWEHPNYQVMLEMLDDCNCIKYAAYRAASKLCVLQRFFNLNQVQLKCISGVFEKHQMHVTENNLDLSSTELQDIVYDILYAAKSSATQPSIFNVDLNTELILIFLLSVFDSSKRKTVKVLSAKVVLTILSASSMQEKIHYLFAQLSDHNNCISRRKMECFLQSCSSLMHYLAESLAFSSGLIKPTLQCCFQGGDKFVGLSEDAFVRWFLSEPQILLWFPIFYRLKTAENEIHLVQCGVCKMYPIRGLRYKCLRCMSYDQCQNCFFNRRISRRHKLSHPMQEFCWRSGSRRSAIEYIKSVIKRMCGQGSRLQYLPVEPSDVIIETEEDSKTIEPDFTLSNSTLKPENELSSIICLLEIENHKLEGELRNIDHGVASSYLIEHKDQIRNQIQRLKKVKTQINMLRSQKQLAPRIQSTPMARDSSTSQQATHLFGNILSPITSSSSDTGVSMSPESTLSSQSSRSHTDLSSLVSKKKKSSNSTFDFSVLLGPKEVHSYHINSDKENTVDENTNVTYRPNSSFSLDEALGKLNFDSQFSSFATAKSYRDKTKSLHDISKSNMTGSSSMLHSGLLYGQDTTSKLSAASCYSTPSLHHKSSRENILNKTQQNKSLTSQDYLNQIASTFQDLPLGQNSSRTKRRDNSCQERIRRRKTIVSENLGSSVNMSHASGTSNLSSSTLPRMFRTPLMEKPVTQNTTTSRSSSYFSNAANSYNGTRNSLATPDFSSLQPSYNFKSSDSNLYSKQTPLSRSKLSQSCDLTSSQKYEEEWSCQSLNSLLSQHGLIEQSIRDLSESGEADEQLSTMNQEIDNILFKLKTILASV